MVKAFCYSLWLGEKNEIASAGLFSNAQSKLVAGGRGRGGYTDGGAGGRFGSQVGVVRVQNAANFLIHNEAGAEAIIDTRCCILD